MEKGRNHDHGHDHEHEHEHGGHGHNHSHTNTKAVLDRLAKATGHLNSVRKMVENGRDCTEVIVQLAAVRSAINGICQLILQDHIDHCIVEAVETGDAQAIEELNKAINQLIKN